MDEHATTLPDSTSEPGSAELQLGIQLFRSGEFVAAERLYRRVLALSGEGAQVCLCFGVLEDARGNFQDAADWLDRSLAASPNDVATLLHLGLVQRKRRLWPEALASFERARELRPDLHEPHRLAGTMLAQMGRPAEAKSLLLQAVSLSDAALQANPADYLALNCRAYALHRLRDHEAALDAFTELSRLRPDDMAARTQIASLLNDLHRYDEAIVSTERLLEENPADTRARLNLGNAYLAMDRLEEAILEYEHVLRIEPEHAGAIHNAALAFGAQERTDDAVAYFKRAIELEPHATAIHMALAYCFLQAGRFAEGWAAHECRGDTHATAWVQRDFAGSRWTGEQPIVGKTLLLYGEQGFGDVLQFCRYASELSARGAQVILEIQPQLMELLRSLPGDVRVVPYFGADQPYDFHCPLLSVPHRLGDQHGAFPFPEGYLRAPEDAIARWRSALPPRGRMPAVGVAWSGNPGHHNDWRRSMPLEFMADLPEGPSYWCVQKHVPAMDVEMLERSEHIHRLDLGDFDDTAGLIANLDLVIAVDTSVAHLAAAMGKPTWLLLSHGGEWRWLTARTDSPWYASMRIFRQPRPGDWGSVIRDVAAALENFSPAAADTARQA